MASRHRFPWKWWLADLAAPADGAPTVFSTFACGGGSSMGYKLAGFEVIGNCEIDPRMAEVYASNLHPRMSFIEDIREFNAREDLPEELYELDVLDGSPPCSTFSMAGSRERAWGVEKQFAEGQKRQRLDDLFFVFLDTVEKLRPKCFVAENVTGLLKGNARGYVSEIVAKARGIGYEVQLFKLNAAAMGVPQQRERAFFVGNRMGWPRLSLAFDEPPITFGEVREPHGEPYRDTMAERLMRSARRTDHSIGDISERVRGKNSGFTLAINWDDAVAYTTITSERYRGCDGLRLTGNDYRNVQTFPQDYDFGKASPLFVCGMSVPPVMMANIAAQIGEQWLGMGEAS